MKKSIIYSSILLFFAGIFFVTNDAIINYLSQTNVKFYHFIFYGIPIYLCFPFYLFFNGTLKQNIKCIPGFFQYTPEIVLSFLEEDITKQLVNNEIYGKLSNVSTKTQIYNKHFPGILQKKKYDGFEQLNKMDEQLRPTLQQEYGMYSHEVKIEYNELVKQLKGK